MTSNQRPATNDLQLTDHKRQFKMIEHDVKDLNLATAGRYKIEWAESQMPVLKLIRERFSKERPLAGLRVSACLHVTSETAALMRSMQLGGAEIVLCASNPLSTAG